VLTSPAPQRGFPVLPVAGGLAAVAVVVAVAIALWPESTMAPPTSLAPPVTARPALFPPVTPQPMTPTPVPAQEALVPRLAPSPRAEPTPAAQPAAAEGFLQIVVVPWADVTVDGTAVSTGPLRKIRLAAGPHVVRFVHPDYQPLQRRVTVKAAETLSLTVDLPEEAVAKPR
jgi:hypothetical protein